VLCFAVQRTCKMLHSRCLIRPTRETGKIGNPAHVAEPSAKNWFLSVQRNPGSIAPIFKRGAQWIGMLQRTVERVSGHSTRVGATLDLAALHTDLAAITQAGEWKSTRMPCNRQRRSLQADRGRLALRRRPDETRVRLLPRAPHRGSG
jgi:hypothetical protein